jgi:ABC-2 type transport system ATP-binding protein
MSVKVEHLTKLYGAQRAVDDISFEVRTGEVLGFLGPNGAGKSTTMKMVTCFVPQSSGKATVCGFDTMNNPMEVRRKIGYLPESNPLYYDMYVREYLEFIGRVHKLSNIGKRIDEMVDMTGLTRERHKKIGQLSKGYKQRVGIAQAMLHNPDVLILDEPTSGLDPNQLVEIRSLIKNLGKEKTVILSTHIMQEVQAMCDRVIIINKGKLVADDTPEHLQQRTAGETIVRVEFRETPELKLLSAISGVKTVKKEKDNQWLIYSQAGKDPREEIFRFAADKGLTLLTLNKEQSSLENVFQELTNK